MHVRSLPEQDPNREHYIWRKRNRTVGRCGRKKDFPDAERLVKRLVANELVLSFVPEPEQRFRLVQRNRWRRESMDHVEPLVRVRD